MTNFEKYFGELKTVAFAVVMGKPVDCDDDVLCDTCDLFYNTVAVDCYDARMEWLKAEYTDPPETIIPEDTPIDTRVLVSSDGIKWCKKYYAGCVNGEYYAWTYGATSWSCESDGCKTSWRYMKLYNKEEEINEMHKERWNS